jgi:DNA-binding IscR family transcriptional regulator
VVERTGPVTSEDLAKLMATNPVVVRRIMAGLRQQGYVRSEKGHGGGWTLACDLSKVTLRDIYVAIGSPSLLAIGNRTEAPGCLVEQAVNASLQQAVTVHGQAKGTDPFSRANYNSDGHRAHGSQ